MNESEEAERKVAEAELRTGCKRCDKLSSARAGVYGGVADFDGRKKGLWAEVWSYSVSEVDVQL